MTKEEYLERLFYDNWTLEEVEDFINQAIAEHDKAIIDDIDFGYSADMIKGKLINKSYEP